LPEDRPSATVVVADTTPLNYLVLLGQIERLPAFYDRIMIVPAVLQELSHSGTPGRVRSWASKLPIWCQVQPPTSAPDSILNQLDAGERDSIQLALDAGFDTLLMDEIRGRQEAVRRSLRVTGILSILEAASQLGLLDFPATLARLENLGFRLSSRLRDTFLKRNN